MKLSLPLLAVVLASGLPLAACAQQSNAAENGPPPAIQQAHDAAKAAAFNDLTPANRAKVQAIIDQVNNGQLTDLKAAAQQIDAALSPTETKAVLAERTKMMAAVRANMPARPDGMGPGGPNGGPPNAGPNGAPPNANGERPHSGFGGRGGNDAGRFLLQLGVSREKMHALRMQQMQNQQPH
jgi:hypothetical protein